MTAGRFIARSGDSGCSQVLFILEETNGLGWDVGGDIDENARLVYSACEPLRFCPSSLV